MRLVGDGGDLNGQEDVHKKCLVVYRKLIKKFPCILPFSLRYYPKEKGHQKRLCSIHVVHIRWPVLSAGTHRSSGLESGRRNGGKLSTLDVRTRLTVAMSIWRRCAGASKIPRFIGYRR